jgi:branched-chain amino acid transport system substrate-binding protein
MRKSPLTVFLMIMMMVPVLVLSVYSESSSAATASKEKIKIGFLSSMSGVYAGIRPWWEWAVNMVIDNTNTSGGLLGRDVQLVLKDDQGDPSLVAQKLTDLKGEGCVLILGPFLGACGPPAQQWAGTNKIPLVTFSDPRTSARVNNNKYTFFTNPDGDTNNEAIYRGILSKPVKTIYAIAVDIVNCHDQYDYIWARMKKEHPDVVNLGAVWLGLTEMEFSNQISAALAKKPDVLCTFIAGPPWAALAQQADKFNLFQKTRAVGQYLLEPVTTTPFGKDYPTGIESTVWCPFWDKTNKAMQDYVQGHLKATKLYPCDKGLEFHIAALAAMAAIKKAGSADPDAIVKGLETLNIDTPIGPVQFHDYDHQVTIPIWWATSAYSPDYPIAIGINMIYYGSNLYPTKDEILRRRAAGK